MYKEKLHYCLHFTEKKNWDSEKRSNFVKGIFKTSLLYMLRRDGKAMMVESVNKFVERSEINFAFHKAYKIGSD